VLGVATLSAALVTTAAAGDAGRSGSGSSGAEGTTAVAAGQAFAGDRDQRPSRNTERQALTTQREERAHARAARQRARNARQHAREVRQLARQQREARAEARRARAARQRQAARHEARQAARKAARQEARIAARHWVLPLRSYNVTAHFGEVSYLWSNAHTGLDFAAPTGTPVRAVAASVVAETGYEGAYGNRVVLRLADGTRLWFCHLNTIDVSVGEPLAAGQQLGTVGYTGNTTGPHLHLEVRINGTPVDPYSALVNHGLQP
jgi:murein DD-endopeptidase MepM/ murein hydrolase activator NlpD